MSGLPSGWVETPIGELVELNPKNTCDDNTEVGFVPMPLMGTTYLSKLSHERRQWHEVKKGYTHFADGDVLLGKITPCFENGKAGLASDLPNALGTGSTEYFVCRPRPILHPRYLLAYFKTRQFVSNGTVEMTGSVGHKRVPKNYVTETKIPLAPLPEQKRIADKLDSVLARVDACRDRLDRLPALLKRFRQSILATATSGKLTEDWRELNLAEQDWNATKLEDLCTSVFDGPFGSNLKSDDYTSSGVRVVRLENIGHLYFEASKETYISDEKYRGLAKHRLQPDDILFSSFVDEEVRVCLYPAKLPTAAINKADCFCLRPDTFKCIPSYLSYRLASRATYVELKELVHGATRPRINLKQLRQYLVEVPELEEQTEIVRRVEILFAFADRLEARLASARRQVGQLTPALLAKAFRGELVSQDPADEPAAALLKRLAAQRENVLKAKRGRKITNP
jgi:type I restriction enzyme S subunit